jgi:urea carboxylase
MEGPGGYQFVGRTVPVWSRWHTRGPFRDGLPWLLRHFDRIRWYPVAAEELLDLRADMTAGRLEVAIEPGSFSLSEHEAFLAREQDTIATFQETQGAAFAAERERWRASGEFDRQASGDEALRARPTAALPRGAFVVTAPLAGSVWRVEALAGDAVRSGAPLVILEAMKLEVPVNATVGGTVHEVLVRPGDQVAAGDALAVVRGSQ